MYGFVRFEHASKEWGAREPIGLLDSEVKVLFSVSYIIIALTNNIN